jgi:hypothetical protein
MTVTVVDLAGQQLQVIDVSNPGTTPGLQIVAGPPGDTAIATTKVDKNTLAVDLFDHNVKPANSAATNASGFAAAVATGATSFFLRAGTYAIQLTEGGNLMSFASKNHIRIRGDNAVLNDTTTYTNDGPLTCMVKLDACNDFEISGVEYIGPVLGSPTTLLGYQGATFIRAINGCNGVKVDATLTNMRYGIHSGEYGDATKGNCKNFDLALRTTLCGYPVAVYLAENVNARIDCDGIHRAAYLAGVLGGTINARWKNQYIADTVVLVTDALVSGTDAAAQVAPPANPTTSRGCENLDIVSIDKGSTVWQSSSMCAGITLSRVDTANFRNLRFRVQTVTTNSVSTQVGGFRIVSDAKTVWSRYAFNFESTILLENVTLSGVLDHSAQSSLGNISSDLYVIAYESSGSHAATVRNLTLDQLVIRKSSTETRSDFVYCLGLVDAARVAGLKTDGVLELLTNATAPTTFVGSKLKSLTVSGVTGGSRVNLSGSEIDTLVYTGTPSNIFTQNTLIGGAGGLLKYSEQTLTLSGASTSWTAAIPQGAMLLAVQTRVQTTITGATSGWALGVAAEAARYGNFTSAAAGTTTGLRSYSATELYGRIYAAATDLQITPNGGSFTGGVVRIVITYLLFPNPTV